MGQAGRSRVSDEQLLAAAREAPHLHALLKAVGLTPYGRNDTVVRARLERLEALDERFAGRSRPTQGRTVFDPDALAVAVAAATGYAGVLRALGLEPVPRHYRHLRSAIARAGLSTEHFTGQAWARGTRRLPLAELLVAGRHTSSGALRCRLVDEGLLAARCQGCGLDAWRGRPLPLELDHVNGDPRDNRLENLRLLCPNCHAQTDTWRGRNIGRAVEAVGPEDPAGARQVRILRPG